MRKRSLAVAGFTVGIAACAGESREPVNPHADDGSVARASVVSSQCGSRATLIELPEHCRWPEGSRRSNVLAASANVVVDVDETGAPKHARVATASKDPELDAAVVACAMQGRYRPAWNGAGETCPTTIRLARYASDLSPRSARLPGDCDPTTAGGSAGIVSGGMSTAVGPASCTMAIDPVQR